MVDVNAGIYNVGTGTRTSAVIIRISSTSRLRARDSGKAPIGILLSSLDGDDGILLDVVDLELC